MNQGYFDHSKLIISRHMIFIFVLLACLGQPNAVYLVVPFFYPVLAIYYVALFLFLLARDNFRISNYVVRMPINLPLAIFLLLALLSVLHAPEPIFALTLLISAAFKVMMFYTLIIAGCQSCINDVVARAIVLAAFVFSFTGIVLSLLIMQFDFAPYLEIGSLAIGGGLEYEHQLRFYGLGFVRSETRLFEIVFPRLQSFFAEPGYFGFFLELSLFVTLYYKNLSAKSTRLVHRSINMAATLQVFALLLTLSFGALTAIGIGMMVYYLISRSLRLTVLMILRIGMVLVIIVIFSMLWENELLPLVYKILIGERFETAYGANSADTRMDVFWLGINLIEQRPWIGWGFGQVRILLEGAGVNNSLLTVFVELGMIGLLVYIAIFWMIMRTIFKCLMLSKLLSRSEVRETAAIAGMFTATTLHSLILDTSWSFIYWLAIALVFLHYRHLLSIARGVRCV